MFLILKTGNYKNHIFWNQISLYLKIFRHEKEVFINHPDRFCAWCIPERVLLLQTTSSLLFPLLINRSEWIHIKRLSKNWPLYILVDSLSFNYCLYLFKKFPHPFCRVPAGLFICKTLLCPSKIYTIISLISQCIGYKRIIFRLVFKPWKTTPVSIA